MTQWWSKTGFAEDGDYQAEARDDQLPSRWAYKGDNNDNDDMNDDHDNDENYDHVENDDDDNDDDQ